MSIVRSNETSPAVQWRAVFAGTVIGLATLVLLTALWAALAFGTNQAFMADTLHWWVAGSAIFAMFLAAYVGGWLSGIRGALSGFFTGATVWALVIVATVAVGIPAVAQTFAIEPGTLAQTPEQNLWAFFWALLIGLGAAVVGGIFGGMMPSRAAHHGDTMIVEEPATVVREVPRPADSDARTTKPRRTERRTGTADR